MPPPIRASKKKQAPLSSLTYTTRLEEKDAAISDAGNIAVWPAQVLFKDVEPAKEYRMVVKVRNIGSLARRVRFSGPALSCFRMVEYPRQNSGPLAPGMYSSFEIVFYWPDDTLRDDQKTSIKIATEVDVLELPISACVPAPDVCVPTKVDLGDVITQNSAMQMIEIENKGSLAGKFRIEYDQRLPLSVTPQVGQVEAHSKSTLKFELRGKDAGPFHAEVRVLAFPGLTLPVEVSARVVEQRLELVCAPDAAAADKHITLEFAGSDSDDEMDLPISGFGDQLQGQSHSQSQVHGERERRPKSGTSIAASHASNAERELIRIDFGTLYYGQERTVLAKLVNRGPHPSTYVVDNPADRDGTPSMQRAGSSLGQGQGHGHGMPMSLPIPTPEPSYDDEDSAQSAITVLPFEGKLGPFKFENMKFNFAPKIPEKRAGFVSRQEEEDEGHEFDTTIVIDVVETEQKLEIHVVGRAVKPTFGVSKTVFHFGDCPSGDHREIEFQITNGCPELPVPFSFTKAAHFHIHPSTGKLLAGSTKKIVASFSPNQMGRFNAKVDVNFGAPPIVTNSLSFYGSSLVAGQKKKLVGGVDALPSDFQKGVQSVDESSPSLINSITPRAMVREHEKTRIKKELFDQPTALVDAAFRLGHQQAQWKMEERVRYDAFLKTSRENREEGRKRRAHVSQLDYENEVDIGIVPGSEMEAPEPELPAAVDALWLERESADGREGGKGRRQHRRMRNLDALAAHLAKKRYKPEPTTPAEVRECVQALSPSQLVSVTSGTKNIDFGEVCVFSEHVKSFVCINDLRQHVLVELRHESPELDRSGPSSQVIPPGGVAGFDVVFSSPVVQNFIAHMTYTINGIHSYKLNVASQVVPTQIDLSANVLEFSFLDNDLDMSTSELLQLKNPGTYPAQFKWDVPNPETCPFVPDVIEGTVEAGRTLTTHVTFTPGITHLNEATLTLLVHGGMEMPLKCVGNLVETRCTFVEKSVDYGIVPVGLSKDVTVTLRNPSIADAVFAWDQTRNTGLQETASIVPSPPKGRVPASGSTEITLSLTPSAPGVLSGSITFHIRGGKQLRLAIHAEAAIPQVTVEPETVDFGSVYVGVAEERQLTVFNQGTIMAQICVNFESISKGQGQGQGKNDDDDDEDLPASSQFSIIPPKVISKDAAGSQSTGSLANARDKERDRPSTPLITALVPSMSVMSNGGQTYTDFVDTNKGKESDRERDQDMDSHPHNMNDDEEEEEVPTAWLLTVPPGSCLQFLLVYKPTDIGTFDFPLPVRVTGANEEEVSTPIIKAAAKRAPLLVSERVIDFGTRVVMRGPSGQRGHYASLIVTSNSDITVSWRLDLSKTDDGSGSPFKFEPSSGILDPHQRSTVRVTFAPQHEGVFERKIPLLHNDGKYLSLEVKGVCTHPRLSFDRREVILQPVPVGFLAQAIFGVVNQGYDNIDVKCRPRPEASNIPLSFAFPEGTVLSFNRPKIPCIVSFRSRKPMSFTAPIDFLDADSNKYTMHITGVCDNSMLTLYPFLKLRPDSYEYAQGKQGRPAMLIEPSWARENAGIVTPAPGRDKRKPPSSAASDLNSSIANSTNANANAGPNAHPALTLVPSASPGPRDAFEKCVAPFDESNITASGRSPRDGGSEDRDNDDSIASPPIRGIVPGNRVEVYTERGAAAIVSFLNSYALRTTVENVQAFSSQSGKFFVEVLETLSGKNMSTILKILPRPSDHRDHRIVATLKQYGEALAFMRQNGALLGPVRPEYLLKFDEFRRLLRLKGIENVGGAPTLGSSSASTQHAVKKRLETLFPELNRQAWITTLLQAIRVFVLGKIHLRTLKQLPGMDKPLARDEKGLETNMYSTSEALLLKWLAYHYHSGTGEHHKVGNFHSDLRDGVVLLGVVQSHTGAGIAGLMEGKRKQSYYGGGIDDSPRSQGQGQGQGQRRSTIVSPADAPDRLIKIMQEIGLDFRIAPTDITDGDPMILELLSLYLFHTLPQYVPKTNVAFSTRLGQRVERQIELENSTTRAIQYSASIYGDATEFMFADSETRTDILVEAKSKKTLAVVCLARLLRPATARLILVPQRRSGALPAEPLVFKLTAQPPGGSRSSVSNLSGEGVGMGMGAEADQQMPMHGTPRTGPDGNQLHGPGQTQGQPQAQDGTVDGENQVHATSQEEAFKLPPQAIVEVESRMYEMEVFEVEFKSPVVDRDVSYRVKVYMDLSLDPNSASWTEKADAGSKGNANRLGMRRGRGKKKKAGESERDRMIRTAAIEAGGPLFIPHTEEVFVPASANGKGSLTLSFLPLIAGKLRAKVILAPSQSQGSDLGIELRGIVKPPAPAPETLKYVCEANRPQTREIVVPVRNVLLEKLRDQLVDRATRDRRSDGGGRRQQEGKWLRAQLANLIQKISGAVDAAIGSPGGVVYHLDSAGRFFNVPHDVQLVKVGGAGDKVGRASGLMNATAVHELNSFPLTLNPRGPGTYSARIIAKSPLDMRVYDIEARAVAPGMRATLEFNTASRQVISQEIPFENPSEGSALLRCQLSGKYFSGPRELMVPGGGSSMYQLVFKPLTPGVFDGELVMSNDRTGERSVFTLHGVAEEPYAEDHIVIQCTAHGTATQRFTLPSSVAGSASFNVTCDLPFVSGPSEYKNGMQPYVLEVSPLQAGNFSGALSFTSKESDRQTIWYTIELQAQEPAPQKEINVDTTQRVPVAVSVTLSNPIDEPIEFEIVIEGDDPSDPQLVGPDKLELGPKESKSYELYYLAILPGEWDAVVRFLSDKAGEFWYLLHLAAAPAEPVHLRRMNCEVGTKSSQAITIENPLESDVVLTTFCDNERNFKVVPETLAVSGLGTASALIEYTPSSMGNKERAEIVLSHAKIGEFRYIVEGTGKAPTRMPSREIVCTLGSVVTDQISFRNPFPDMIRVTVDATSWPVRDSKKQGEGIRLLTPSNTSDGSILLDVPPFGEEEIPFSFQPKMLSEYASTITIRGYTHADRKLSWPFPVVGVVEAPPSATDTSALLSCRARTTTDAEITLTLHHAPPIPLDAEHATPALSTARESKFFHYEAISDDREIQSMIAGCLRINLVSVEPDPTNRAPVLTFKAQFAPLRPASGACELVVRRRGVGQWRRNITIKASEPEIDDIIRIETMLGHTGSVSFKLRNMFDSPASFKAFFSSSSPAEFTVVPPHGDLPPSSVDSDDGTVFVVSYTPTQYGKQLSGQLIILTDEVQWTYDIRGQHPEYKSPTRKQLTSNVDSRLRPEVLAGLSKYKKGEKKKQFVTQNIRQSATQRRGK